MIKHIVHSVHCTGHTTHIVHSVHCTGHTTHRAYTGRTNIVHWNSVVAGDEAGRRGLHNVKVAGILGQGYNVPIVLGDQLGPRDNRTSQSHRGTYRGGVTAAAGGVGVGGGGGGGGGV